MAAAHILFPLGPALATMMGLSCVQVDGGAIEASWVLRTFDGRSVDGCACANPAIAHVRFVVVDEAGAGDDVCAGNPGCEFSCGSQRGATPFFVPSGRYAISVAAVDASGTALPPSSAGTVGIRVPAPILRDVVRGQPTELDAVAIESGCAAACNGDRTDKACSRN